MIRSLYTAATGMIAQQQQMDVTSNNIANVNTSGFKKQRAEFKDLLYQDLNFSSKQTTENALRPVGIQVGLGSKISAINKLFTQGSLVETGNNLDIAITGKGFLKMILPNGEEGFTRDGNLKIDANGTIVTTNGLIIQPELTIPENTATINISQDGIVTSTLGDNTSVEVGQIRLYDFINPAGLSNIGANNYIETPNSGVAIEDIPGLNGLGTIEQGFLETSNVQLVTEMTDLITGQRAYEANSKSVKTADEMLQIINNLKA
jgi:flagellar basal-body rod protein FlgG